MQDKPLIFDTVMHLYDMRRINAQRTLEDRRRAYKIFNQLTGNVIDFTRLTDTPDDELHGSLIGDFEVIYDMMFDKGPIDMAIVGNGAALQPGADETLRLCFNFAQKYPDRAVLGGGVDPVAMGLKGALDQIEYQVRELGAKSMKFYPFTWKCDDREIAYPLFAKCRDLGVKLVQFHKLLPGMLIDTEVFKPNEIQAPARDFPELSFLIHHPGDLYFYETVDITQRFPNVYLVLTPTLHMLVAKPRWAQEKLGFLLQQCGPEKLLYGSEGPALGDPNIYVDAFLNMTMPQDLQEGYGYPDFTAEDRALVLGGNLARLLGIDLSRKQFDVHAVPTGA